MWRVLLGTLLMVVVQLSASVCDLRTRRIPDIHWAVGGTAAALVQTAFAPDDVTALLSVIGSFLVMAYMLTEIPGIPLFAGAFASFGSAAYLGFEGILAVPVMCSVLALMYRFGVIRGGADVKSLMVLSVAYPLYPEIGGLPLVWQPVYPDAYLICPVFSVLVLALLFSLAYSPVIFVRNLMDGYRGPGMFTGYSVPMAEAGKMHAWPLEDAVDGVKIGVKAGEAGDGALERLADIGETEVRVTPMIPFILPITLGLVFVLVLGSPLFVLAA